MANTNDESFYDSVAASNPEYGNESVTLSDAERAKQEELWKAELIRLDEEIGTLKSVLNAKINEATELKRKLGITPMVELREDLKHSWQAIRDSDTYQRTNSALKNFGAFASKKMGDLKNSNAFKSVEGKVGGAYTSIKKQVSGEQTAELAEEAVEDSQQQQQQTLQQDQLEQQQQQQQQQQVAVKSSELV